MRFSKIKAGALQLTMFIMMVVAILLMSFILLVDTHKRFQVKTNFLVETVDLVNQGLGYALTNNIISGDTLLVNYNSEDFKSLKIIRDYWGVFEKVMVDSKIKNNRLKKVVLVGAKQPELNRTALFLADNNRPLVVVGETKIVGTCFLPKQGVRTGNIAGYSYYGSQLIYGDTQISGELPELAKENGKYITNLEEILNHLDQNQFLDMGKEMVFKNSFFDPLKVLYSPVEINIEDYSVTGHIIIQSKTRIIVGMHSKLQDVVLVAPEIVFESGFSGTCQAIATKKIEVEKSCVLNYPSSLILKASSQQKLIDEKKDKPQLTIGEHSEIKGAVAYIGHVKNYKTQVNIARNTIIKGEVYCEGNLELEGAVIGSVFTSNFVANQSGSSYQNHLYNAQISIEELPIQYVGLMFDSSDKAVVKWLY
ncbi:hypothetical protein [Aestuariibaculum sediminum]|uniref:Uncharacterized protein n=1 Tax=Aestuariibaculum sediminum TaxID=2770637 RepID=A0A8J6Q9A5_9FLAO|nr:hypothetical protein [Aestuariibaculum sediminum]MBD0833793.1 hypothetical protein [Aestuariibaculum sediminum]